MPAWRRVRDKVTGHQYDIPAENLPLPEGIEEVKRHPVIEGPGELPRPPKPHASRRHPWLADPLTLSLSPWRDRSQTS